MQQVMFMPNEAKNDVGHPSVKFGFITSIAPSGLLVYCRFWKEESLRAMQRGAEVPEIEQLQNPAISDGCQVHSLFPYQSLPPEKIELIYRRIYVDSIVIASRLLKFCANVLVIPLTPSVQAGTRGEMKHVTFQDFRQDRISFAPTYGWEAQELKSGHYWRPEKYMVFLKEVLSLVGEDFGEKDDLYWVALRSITIDEYKAPTEFFYHTFKFKRGLS